MSESVNFTEALIRNIELPPKGQRLVLKDTQVSGLQCRISSSGVKTFSVYRRINGGNPERITLGKSSQISVEKARNLAKEIHGAAARGENPADIKRLHKGEKTFDELFSEYLYKHAKLKKRTWKGDEGRYKLYLKPKLGNKRISQISRSDIAAIHNDVSSRIKKTSTSKDAHIIYISGTTANRILALASSIFGWGVHTGICKTNPASGIKKNSERSRDRFLQADELPRFFESLEKEENLTLRDFIKMALLTGARRENVMSMAWGQISFERKEWRIPRTKNNDPQTVPLGKEAMAILRNRKKESEKAPFESSPFIFPGTGKKGYLAEPRKGWHRILKRANIENLRIHDLRRTLGSWQAKTGASLIIVGKSLGHKSPQATAIYSRLDLDPVRKSVETATNAIYKASRKKLKNKTED